MEIDPSQNPGSDFFSTAFEACGFGLAPPPVWFLVVLVMCRALVQLNLLLYFHRFVSYGAAIFRGILMAFVAFLFFYHWIAGSSSHPNDIATYSCLCFHIGGLLLVYPAVFFGGTFWYPLMDDAKFSGFQRPFGWRNSLEVWEMAQFLSLIPLAIAMVLPFFSHFLTGFFALSLPFTLPVGGGLTVLGMLIYDVVDEEEFNFGGIWFPLMVVASSLTCLFILRLSSLGTIALYNGQNYVDCFFNVFTDPSVFGPVPDWRYWVLAPILMI